MNKLPRERLCISLDGETFRAVNSMAERLHMNRSEAIEVIIATYFCLAKLLTNAKVTVEKRTKKGVKPCLDLL